MQARSCVLLLALILAACSRPDPAFLPPKGERLLGLGQPLNEPEDARLWQPPPALVMSYTALPGLPGITEAIDVGSGQAYLDEQMRRYPHSALALGLYLVGQTERIARGELDGDIDRLIELTARYRRPVYLRFGYEFDGPWNRYPPESYVAAWKHFRARLRKSGARHIAMVWQSAGHCGNTFGAREIQHWYPGDDQVDWIGLSYFFPNACGGMVAEGVATFARRHGKPLMIAESTPRGYDLAGLRYSGDRKTYYPKTADEIWAQWFQPFLDFIERNDDVVRAVFYLNGHWEAYPMWGPVLSPDTYWGDSRLEGNAELLERWRQTTQARPWRRGSDSLFRDLGYRP